MSQEPYDIRQQFWRDHFRQGQTFSDYIQSGTENQLSKWKSYESRIQLTQEEQSLCSSFARQVNILFISGIWCGDCMRQGPMLRAIAEASSVTALHFIENVRSKPLLDEVRIQGGSRVPVVVFLSEDFFEVSRFGDRTLSAYRRKAQTELGAACDAGLVPPTEEELREEVSDWLREVERVQHILRLSPFLRARHGD